MASLDSFSWEMLHCCPPVFRHIPEHWRHSFAEAKVAVVTSLLNCSNVVDEAERARSIDRHWKLLCVHDAMLFNKPPKFRGGKKGQAAGSLNGMFTERVRAFWCGDWQYLWLEVESAAERNRAAKSSPEAIATREAKHINELLHESLRRRPG